MAGPRRRTMPYGPKRQWRPPDPVAAGVYIGQLMVRERIEVYGRSKARQQSKAGVTAAVRMTPKERTKRAKAAAEARWSKRR